ncbi:poly-gamma-glutamate hydrolase family protein [Rhizobium leguminosarum]|uniref:poly-gamma-glutamate hydrolase family protein n=1 Tax=Rhizobium leguminosarum TaxID=384 RepID=UPI003D027906
MRNPTFPITALDGGSDVCAIAPHGGKIEPSTSELARAVASDTCSLCLFEGRKNSGNRDLHITSTNFDEPRGDALVRKGEVAIAFHGGAGEGETIFLGGRHQQLNEKMGKNLLDAGFAVTAITIQICKAATLPTSAIVLLRLSAHRTGCDRSGRRLRRAPREACLQPRREPATAGLIRAARAASSRKPACRGLRPTKSAPSRPATPQIVQRSLKSPIPRLRLERGS